MPTLSRKHIILIAVVAVVLVAVVYGFWPDPLPVQTAPVERDSLQVVVEEEGETQVQERYEVSSPAAAFARRIEVEAGDVVEEGQPLVQLEAPRASILDPRSRAEAQARAEAAEARMQRPSARWKPPRPPLSEHVKSGNGWNSSPSKALPRARRWSKPSRKSCRRRQISKLHVPPWPAPAPT